MTKYFIYGIGFVFIKSKTNGRTIRIDKEILLRTINVVSNFSPDKAWLSTIDSQATRWEKA